MFALTYSIFFGLMFGDVGQGAVIMLVGLFLYFVKHVNLGGIFAFVGAFAMGGGFLYGSVFGNEELIHGLFVPSENINGTLLAAVSIGVVMIIVCGIVNIINGIRQKKVVNIFSRRTALSASHSTFPHSSPLSVCSA